MCQHRPPCPLPTDTDATSAHTVLSHPEQGWALLCNGVVFFEDTYGLRPDGTIIESTRPARPAYRVAA